MNPIYNKIKYNCSLKIQDKPIINMKVLDKFEFSDKTVNITGISLMVLKYKNNLQNVNSNYFLKDYIYYRIQLLSIIGLISIFLGIWMINILTIII